MKFSLILTKLNSAVLETPMHKYFSIFTITLQEYFVYRLNFIMWRLRQFFVFLIPYFIWRAALKGGGELYGYDFARLMTYLFGSTILRSLVMGSRTVDLGWMINSGYLSIPLLQPFRIFPFFFIRDLADKFYNLSSILIELPIIYFLFRPPIFLQVHFFSLLVTFLAVALAILIYFYLNLLFGSVAFWSRDTWAPRFLLWVVMEFATGALFPLDMLPPFFLKLLSFTPFPYLLFTPLQIYLGNSTSLLPSFSLAFLWVLILAHISHFVWDRGLKVYEAEGR